MWPLSTVPPNVWLCCLPAIQQHLPRGRAFSYHIIIIKSQAVTRIERPSLHVLAAPISAPTRAADSHVLSMHMLPEQPNDGLPAIPAAQHPTAMAHRTVSNVNRTFSINTGQVYSTVAGITISARSFGEVLEPKSTIVGISDTSTNKNVILKAGIACCSPIISLSLSAGIGNLIS